MSKLSWIIVGVAVTVCALAGVGVAEGGGWEVHGPADGVVGELVPHPSEPGVVYALTARGVARSSDGGRSWVRTHPDDTRWDSITQMVVDEGSGALFIQTRKYLSTYVVYRSRDEGATWQAVKEGDTRWIAPYTAAEGRGILVWSMTAIEASVDGGATWSRLTDDRFPPDGGLIWAVETAHDVPGQLHVSAGPVMRSRVYTSRSGGRTWALGDPSFSGEIRVLAAGASAGSPLFASAWRGPLRRSLDGGSTWVEVTPPVAGGGITLLEVPPLRPHELWAVVDGDSLFRSTDAGDSWRREEAVTTTEAVARIAFDPADPAVVYLGGALLPHGVHRSDDDGVSWQASTAGLPPVKLRSVVVDQHDPSTVYAAADLYGGQHGGLYVSHDRGHSWTMLPGSELAGDQVALDPANPAHLYAGSQAGLLQSFDGGATWRQDSSTLGEDRVDTVSLDPHRPGALFVTTSPRIGSEEPAGYRSFDGGASWEQVLDDEPEAFVHDPVQPGVVYGLTSWRLWRSSDWGSTWTTLHELDGTWNEVMTDLVVVPATPDRLLLATDRWLELSDDGGATWRSAADGLEVECRSGWWDKDSLVSCNGPRALAASPLAGGPVYLATGLEGEPSAGSGVSVATADGAGWRQLAFDPEVAGGQDLAVAADGRTLYLAAAHGGVAVLELVIPSNASGRRP